MRAKKSVSLRAVVVLLAVVLLIGCTVGGTLAWLVTKTEPITNTFSTSDITITLEETPAEFKMVPGADIAKDPTVTVKKGSEACYVFVKVEESANLDDYITYSIASPWQELQTGIYFCQVMDTTDDVELPVLVGDKVHVRDSVTKADMTAANTSKPTLTFTAYAVQNDGFVNATAAWAEASKLG